VVDTKGSHGADVFDFGNDGDFDIFGANFNTNTVDLWENLTDPLPAIGYWSFDEGSGSRANDSSGNNHHGTISGALWEVGKKGNALRFDGIDDVVTIANDSQLQITDDITIAAWIQKDLPNLGLRWEAIVTKGALQYDYELLTSKEFSDQPAFYSPTTVPTEVYADSALPAESWQHIAVTRTGSTVTFYINGLVTNVVTMAGRFPVSTGDLLIGFDGNANNGMDGLIDEVYLYNRALSSSEIQGLVIGVVPVELSSFSARFVNNIIHLEWQTQTETNNFGFDVERKIASEWDKIGFVEGNGTTVIPQDYAFQDSLLNLDDNVPNILYRLKQIDTDGSFDYSPIITVNLDNPKTFQLLQNFPNPFNPETEIRFQLPKTSNVDLTIYNTRGQVIRRLLSQSYTAGEHSIKWDGRDQNGDPVSSGVYLYQLRASNFRQVKKMTLLR